MFKQNVLIWKWGMSFAFSFFSFSLSKLEAFEKSIRGLQMALFCMYTEKNKG